MSNKMCYSDILTTHKKHIVKFKPCEMVKEIDINVLVEHNDCCSTKPHKSSHKNCCENDFWYALIICIILQQCSCKPKKLKDKDKDKHKHKHH